MATRDDIYNSMRMFESVISKETMVSNILSSGVLGNICLACAILSFLFVMILVLKKGIKKGFTKQDFYPELIKLLVLLAIFGNVVMYTQVVNILHNLSDSINNALTLDVRSIKNQIQYLFHEMVNKRLDKINIINPLTWISTLDILTASVFFYFFIVTLYTALTIPAILFALAIIIAPIIVSFAIIEKEYIYNWLYLLMASLFMGFIVSIIMKIIENTDMLVFLAETFNKDNTIVIITVCMIYALFVVFALGITAHLFNIKFLNLFKVVFPVSLIGFCFSHLYRFGRMRKH